MSSPLRHSVPVRRGVTGLWLTDFVTAVQLSTVHIGLIISVTRGEASNSKNCQKGSLPRLRLTPYPPPFILLQSGLSAPKSCVNSGSYSISICRCSIGHCWLHQQHHLLLKPQPWPDATAGHEEHSHAGQLQEPCRLAGHWLALQTLPDANYSQISHQAARRV